MGAWVWYNIPDRGLGSDRGIIYAITRGQETADRQSYGLIGILYKEGKRHKNGAKMGRE